MFKMCSTAKVFLTTVVVLIISLILISGCTNKRGGKSIYPWINPGQSKEVESEPNITLAKLNSSLDLAKEWLINNFNEKGIFNYQYDPSSEKYSGRNNMIRQLMSSRLLAELSQDNSDLRKMHKKNLDFIFRHWYREGGYIYYNSKSKLGANAMALRTLVYSPFFDDYRDEAEELANTILSLQNPDGSLEPWYIEPNYKYDKDRLLTFYSGEAILSLVEYYMKTGNTLYLDAAIKSQDFYIEKYVTHLKQNYYPAYVPWHTQSLNNLFKLTAEKKYADAIFVLNDELIRIQNTDSQPWTEYSGRFYHPAHPEYGTPHSSSDAIYTEGLSYACEIARIVDDKEHQEKYRRAIIFGAHNLISLQFKDSNVYNFQHPERVKGAIRYRVEDNRIRIDTTQHTIDAFMKIIKDSAGRLSP